MTAVSVEHELRRAEPSPVAPAPTLDAAPCSGGFVLVVEDNPINRLVIGGLLTKHGIRVENAENGVEAVALITGGASPDLVFMDCQMPIMDGFSATEAIRSWEAQNGKDRLPIVALTAGAFAEDRERCLAAGMDDFLTKPLRLPDLVAVLRRWIADEDGPGAPPPGQEAPDGGKVAVADEAVPVIDAAIALELVDGNLPTLLMMLPIVVGQIAEDRQAIARAIDEHDAVGLKTACHRLKGSVGQIGALPARRRCAALESAAASADPGRFVELQQGLEAELDALSAAIAEFLAKQASAGT